MKTDRPTLALVLLCALGLGTAGIAHGDAAERIALPLDGRERDFLLAEMRAFLGAVGGIVGATAENDMKAVAQAARAVGLAAHRKDFADPASPVRGVRAKAPSAFFPLGQATHAAFDEIADLARDFGDREVVLSRLAENIGRCNACHAAYTVFPAGEERQP